MRQTTQLRRSQGLATRYRSQVLKVSLALWLVTIAVGITWLIDYSTAPGDNAESPMHWPGASGIQRPSDTSTLLLFLHPRCPCSRASLNVLARLLGRSETDVAVLPVVYCPSEKPLSWAQTDLYRAAQRLSSHPIILDRDGQHTEQFGVTTSGHVLLYSSDGELEFSGGITSGRGHEGDNPGSSALTSLLSGQAVATTHFSTYGCPIIAGDEGQSVRRAR